MLRYVITLAAIAITVLAAFYFVDKSAYKRGYGACEKQMADTLRTATQEMRENRVRQERRTKDRGRDDLMRVS